MHITQQKMTEIKKEKEKFTNLQSTLEQHGFEPSRSTEARFLFNKHGRPFLSVGFAPVRFTSADSTSCESKTVFSHS